MMGLVLAGRNGGDQPGSKRSPVPDCTGLPRLAAVMDVASSHAALVSQDQRSHNHAGYYSQLFDHGPGEDRHQSPVLRRARCARRCRDAATPASDESVEGNRCNHDSIGPVAIVFGCTNGAISAHMRADSQQSAASVTSSTQFSRGVVITCPASKRRQAGRDFRVPSPPAERRRQQAAMATNIQQPWPAAQHARAVVSWRPASQHLPDILSDHVVPDHLRRDPLRLSRCNVASACFAAGAWAGRIKVHLSARTLSNPEKQAVPDPHRGGGAKCLTCVELGC